MLMILGVGCSFKSAQEIPKEKGLSPFVADVPELRVRFLQNYTIKMKGIKKGLDGFSAASTCDLDLIASLITVAFSDPLHFLEIEFQNKY